MNKLNTVGAKLPLSVMEARWGAQSQRQGVVRRPGLEPGAPASQANALICITLENQYRSTLILCIGSAFNKIIIQSVGIVVMQHVCKRLHPHSGGT